MRVALLSAAVAACVLWTCSVRGGVVADYAFGNAAALGLDSIGTRNMVCTGGLPVEGPAGPGVAFAGDGGLELPAAQCPDFGRGFGLDLWLRLDDLTGPMLIAGRDGQFLLRLDPLRENGRLSLFVHGEGWEPRLRGPRLLKGKWYHVQAGWDGSQMALIVGDAVARQQRRIRLRRATSPFLLGAGVEWGAPLHGALSAVKLHVPPPPDWFRPEPVERLGGARVEVCEVQNAYPRALRTETVQLRLRADRPLPVGRVVLECTPGLKLLAVGNRSIPELAPDESAVLTWPVTAAVPGVHSLVFSDGEGGRLERQVMFHASLPPRDLTYVPEPSPVQPQALVGAHMCPLWKEGARRAVWRPIVPWRKRKPVLGWYDEGDPEVADWEITWCLDHGISFFVYCWYRTSQGGPVEQKLGHAIHDGLFNARYRDQFKFTIMWENQGKGTAGVASEEDFLKNLLPFWIETYFKHPSYLVLDGKPLLYIYRPEFLIGDLGSTEAVQSALNKAREACRAAGFKGLTLLGEYRGNNREHLQRLVDLGIDCSFAYCWPLSGNPSSPKAVEMQEEIWRERRQQSVLPEMITVSMGWDSRPWKPSSTVWRHTPEDFGDVCRRALAAAREYPEGSLSRRVVLLDNWNEYGEGHYIAPHREYGFGYLDAVRNAFAPQAPQEHVDLTPADVGLGPYDRLYQAAIRESERIGLLMKGQPAAPVTGEGLVAFWSFDEGSDPDVTLDCTGNGRGAHLHDARYAPGVQRRALVCDGSSAQTAPDPVLFPQWLTLSCWVRTDTAGQSNSWFINGVYGGSTDCGYRLGLTRGRLCWGVPETSWSHHLAANEPLPTGRWVHAAATADGEEMCIYMDGKRVAVGKRSVPVGAPLAKPVTLGNYEVGHRAHFVGLLDEVRLYDRVLAPERIAELAGRRATQKLEGGVPPGPRP